MPNYTWPDLQVVEENILVEVDTVILSLKMNKCVKCSGLVGVIKTFYELNNECNIRLKLLN